MPDKLRVVPPMRFLQAFVQEPGQIAPLPQPQFPDGAVALGCSRLPYIGSVLHLGIHCEGGRALCATMSLPQLEQFVDALEATAHEMRQGLGVGPQSVQ
jgi:hypothetical protein